MDPVHIQDLPTELILGIVNKLNLRSYSRLRCASKEVDEFCDTFARQIGIHCSRSFLINWPTKIEHSGVVFEEIIFNTDGSYEKDQSNLSNFLKKRRTNGTVLNIMTSISDNLFEKIQPKSVEAVAHSYTTVPKSVENMTLLGYEPSHRTDWSLFDNVQRVMIKCYGSKHSSDSVKNAIKTWKEGGLSQMSIVETEPLFGSSRFFSDYQNFLGHIASDILVQEDFRELEEDELTLDQKVHAVQYTTLKRKDGRQSVVCFYFEQREQRSFNIFCQVHFNVKKRFEVTLPARHINTFQ